MSGHVDGVISAPLGAALLERLEYVARRRRDPELFEPFLALPDTRADDVDAAARWATTATSDELLHVVLEAGDMVGPWHGSGPENAARATRSARRRRPIAEALVERPDGPLLRTPMTTGQWWWTDSLPSADRFTADADRLGPHFAWVTAPRGAFWTTSPIDLAFADGLTGAWEVEFGPLAIWRLQAAPEVRVYEIHTPADWTALVERYPNDVSAWAARSCSWELSAQSFPNGDPAVDLLSVDRQKAARRGWRQVLMPDWAAVADDWDAVHLSWAGLVTTEGRVIDLDGGDVTILRNWCSERTCWLSRRLDVVAEVLRQPDEGWTTTIAGIVAIRTAEDERDWLKAVLGDRP